MKKRALAILTALTCLAATSKAGFEIIHTAAWAESACVMWSYDPGYDYYHAYISNNDGSWTRLDSMLLRDYGTYARVDALGLQAGSRSFKIVPVSNGAEVPSAALTTEVSGIRAHDRAGFAHMGRQHLGAYNNDGTLREGARVLYVTADNARSLTLDIVTDKKGKTTRFTGLQNIINGYQKGYDTTPLCLRVIGIIERADLDTILSKEEGLQVKGRDKYYEVPITIEGVGNDAAFRGFGILIRNCVGVEVRNLAIINCMDDAISIDTGNSNCWIHNIDFFYGQPGKDSDQAKGDGSLDNKGNSRNMTFSYNHFWDNGKAMLCGVNDKEEQDSRISYHHNWFDHSDSRHPRVRRMTVHVYNNLFDCVAKYGVGATTGSSVFVESNVFVNSSRPMMISMQGTDIRFGEGTFSGEDGGIIKAYGNAFVSKPSNFSYYTHQSPYSTGFDAYEAATRDEQVPSSVTTRQGGHAYNNFDTDATLMYAYTPDNTDDLPDLVRSRAGRMEGGDITFVFTEADATSYDINNALKTLAASHQTELNGILKVGHHTGLDEAPQAVDDRIYDLMGRPVTNPERGHIYIRSGKKFIIR